MLGGIYAELSKSFFHRYAEFHYAEHLNAWYRYAG
jgi:hypothetical protein